MSTKHFCDDCGHQLSAQWWNGSRWGLPDLDLCGRCYRYRVEAMIDPAALQAEVDNRPAHPQKEDA